MPGQPGPGDQLTEERKAKVSGFRLQLDLDEEYGDPPPADPAPAVPEAGNTPVEQELRGTLPLTAQEDAPDQPELEPLLPEEEPEEQKVSRRKRQKRRSRTAPPGAASVVSYTLVSCWRSRLRSRIFSLPAAST